MQSAKCKLQNGKCKMQKWKSGTAERMKRSTWQLLCHIHYTHNATTMTTMASSVQNHPPTHAITLLLVSIQNGDSEIDRRVKSAVLRGAFDIVSGNLAEQVQGASYSNKHHSKHKNNNKENDPACEPLATNEAAPQPANQNQQGPALSPDSANGGVLNEGTDSSNNDNDNNEDAGDSDSYGSAAWGDEQQQQQQQQQQLNPNECSLTYVQVYPTADSELAEEYETIAATAKRLVSPPMVC